MNILNMKSILLFFFLILFSSPSFADEYKGKVVAVHDGDTLTVLAKGKHIKVKLAHIDAPELSQPYGLMAKSYLTRVTFNQWVRVIEEGVKDKLPLVRIYNGNFHVNSELIIVGLAWFDVRYGKDKELKSLEKKARAQRRGLWQDDNPVPPWEYDEKKKGEEKSVENEEEQRHSIEIKEYISK